MSAKPELYSAASRLQVRRVLNNSVLTTLALFIVRAFNALCFFIITWYLGEEQAGIYALALNYALLFSQLALWGLDQVLTREIAHQPDDLASVTGFFLVARTIATVLCYALMVYVVVVIQDYKGLIRDCLLAGGAMMVSESLSRFCQTVFSAYERPQYTVLTNLIGGALKILGIGVIIAIRRMTVFSFVMMIGVTSLITLAINLWYLVAIFGRPKIARLLGYARRYFWISVPFTLISTASAIEFQADIVFISHFVKQNFKVQVGTYNAITVIVYTLIMLTQGIRSALLPGMYRFYHQSRDLLVRFFEKTFKMLVIGTLPICVLIAWFAQDITRLLYGSSFVQAPAGLQVIIWSFLFLTSMLPANAVLQVLDDRRSLITIRMAMTLVNVAVNFLLLPRIGIQGAVWARSVSSGCGWMLNLFFVQRSIAARIDYRVLGKILLGLLLTCGCLVILDRLGVYWMFSGAIAGAVYAGSMLYLQIVNKRELSVFQRVRPAEAQTP